MGFFKKFKRFILPAIGALIAGPAGLGLGIGAAGGAAIGSGVSSYTSHHNIGQALASGLGSYAGSQIAGNVLGDKLGTVGSTAFSSLPGGTASNLALNAIPGSIANTSIGSIIGSNLGSNLAENATAKLPQFASDASPPPFNPSQEEQQATPPNLSGLGSLTSEQQSSNLANQGVYGSGNGPQEQSYYFNLLNRRLVDQSGNTSDLNTLKPIEQSYLQRLGFGGYNNSRNLLEAISKWRQQQVPA